MTTNQTIDGVPRELLELAYLELVDTFSWAGELRALLDAPAKFEATNKQLREALEGMVEYFPEGHSDGECFSLERAREVLALPVAQPPGEPVAWHCVGDIGTENVTLSQDCANAWFSHGGRSLPLVYAEQPAPVAFPGYPPVPDDRKLSAPVAVVLPEGWQDQLLDEMTTRFELNKHDDDHMVYDDTQIGVEFARDWITKRLNAKS